MLHFSEYLVDKMLDEKNSVTSGFGFFSGWVVTIFTFSDIWKAGVMLGVWQLILTSMGGIVISVITAMSLVVAKDFYEHKIKNKLFKSKQNGKEKESDQRAA